MTGRTLLALGWLALLAGVAGCTARQAYDEEVSRTPAAARHAVHSQRLTQVMRRLDRLAGERLPQALDVEAAREPLIEELVTVARAVARSADEIPDAMGGRAASEEEAASVRDRADRLRARALELAEGASRMTSGERRAAVGRLRAVCDDCHAEFRDDAAADAGARP